MRPSALLALLLVLPACSDDGPPPSQAAAVRTPVASPTGSPSASPTPERPQPSPSPTTSAAPAGPVAVPAASGDVDGDGEPDEVRVAAGVEVLLSGGGNVSAPLAADVPPAVRGVEDVDRDGRAEVFVRTGQGASTTFLTPYRYDGQVLAALTVDGSPASLGLGGSATHGDGFSCTAEGGLVVRSATSLDGETWSVTETAYDVVGSELRQTARATVDDLPQDDPRVGQAYLADCRTVGDS